MKCDKTLRLYPALLEYDLGEHVRAFSTTRQGGVSVGAYASFNANLYCGDDVQHVQQNRELLCQFLGLPFSHLLMPHQTHHDKVCKIDESFLSLSQSEREQRLEGIDALMTDLPDVCVSVSTADCIPVLLYDDVHHAVAAVHAGWRGTVSSIVRKTVERMEEVYHTDVNDVKAVIGPGISLDAFEVGDEVYDAFQSAGFPMMQIAKRYVLSEEKTKWHIDLWEANRWELLQSGVPFSHIHLSGICTYSHNDRFFSARRAGIHSGRILNGIMWTGGVK
ncbi:MAG TPA: peptidoglycan editing factor PgeF [Candidatus Paraprevotella stercorigallinarum]|nr:peptidoglycan editing factor PgeF [Candidatus Paraprevotella stercorigallinarum]